MNIFFFIQYIHNRHLFYSGIGKKKLVTLSKEHTQGSVTKSLNAMGDQLITVMDNSFDVDFQEKKKKKSSTQNPRNDCFHQEVASTTVVFLHINALTLLTKT